MADLNESFLAEIRKTPKDDAPRLIYADWLEEFGDQPERAEFIRLQCNPATAESAARATALLAAHPEWHQPFTVEFMGRFMEEDRGIPPRPFMERGFLERPKILLTNPNWVDGPDNETPGLLELTTLPFIVDGIQILDLYEEQANEQGYEVADLPIIQEIKNAELKVYMEQADLALPGQPWEWNEDNRISEIREFAQTALFAREWLDIPITMIIEGIEVEINNNFMSGAQVIQAFHDRVRTTPEYQAAIAANAEAIARVNNLVSGLSAVLAENDPGSVMEWLRDYAEAVMADSYVDYLDVYDFNTIRERNGTIVQSFRKGGYEPVPPSAGAEYAPISSSRPEITDSSELATYMIGRHLNFLAEREWDRLNPEDISASRERYSALRKNEDAKPTGVQIDGTQEVGKEDEIKKG